MGIEPFCVLVLMFSYTEPSIHSTQMHQKNDLRWLDIHPRRSAGDRHFHLKARRSTARQNLITSQFVLDRDTDHTQFVIGWLGNGSQVVFVLTRKLNQTGSKEVINSSLWRTTDYGRSFQFAMNSFSEDTLMKSYKTNINDNRRVVFYDAFNNSRRIWTTADSGASYRPVNTPFSVENIVFHPVNSDWILGYDSSNRELFCSMDFGETWTKLGQEVTSNRFFWYVKNVDTGANAEKIVHFEYRHSHWTHVNRVFKVMSCYIPNCEPTPFQRLNDELENVDEDSLTVQGDYVFVQKTGIAADKLFISYKRRPFVKALFPFYSHVQTHFHVVSSDGGNIVVGINHENRLAHLFVSDVEGKKFRKSLSNVRYFNKTASPKNVFTVDILEMKGINGSFLVNVHNPTGYHYNSTKISWDYGHSWSSITKNVVNEYGSNLHGCRGCSLNLHLVMEQTSGGKYMPPIQAKKSSPGLIVAHGSLGLTLDDRANKVQVYISQDNGRSWKIGRRNRRFMKIGNHGSTIAAISFINWSRTSVIDFSSDYGNSWTTHTFTDVSVYVDALLTEPGETSSYLAIIAHAGRPTYWNIFHINLATYFQRNCSYPADFGNVTFPDRTNACNLGMVQKIERKSSGRRCAIEPSYSRFTNMTKCNCTIEDYECDLGYKHSGSGDNATCEEDENAVGNITNDLYAAKIFDRGGECINSQHNISTGFRKIPGDQCRDDLPGIYQTLEPCDEVDSQTTLLEALSGAGVEEEVATFMSSPN